MLFTVITIENDNNKTLVTGSTTVGYIKGVWRAEEAPENGKKYQVELHFPPVKRSDVTVNSGETCARVISEKTFFSGVCEDIDEVCYIRFSVDGLEMLDVTDIDDSINKGDSVSFAFPFEDIGIYPY